MQAASDLFRRYGYRGASMGAIGQAANMQGPDIYRYFDSKEKILLEIFERVLTTVEENYDVALAEASNPLDALGRLVMTTIDATLENRDLTAVYVREIYNLPPDIRTRLIRRRRDCGRKIEQELRQVRPDLRPRETAVLVAAVETGVLAIATAATSNISPARLRQLLFRFAMGGLLAD